MANKEYFHIDFDHLPREKENFSFNIYIFNPVNDKYTVFLYANSPLTEERKTDIVTFLEKGGSLAVDRKQKKTFLLGTGLNEADVPSLKKKEKHKLESAREAHMAKFEASKGEEDKFMLNHEVNMAIDRGDFTNIIERAKNEILCFDLKISPTVSLAVDFAKKLLTKDSKINRITCLSYFLAKISRIEDEESLSDVVVASFLHHIGFTQLETEYSFKPFMEMSDKQRREYHKHPGLTQHLLRKSGLEISDRAMRIILEHHERIDGTGFPYGKREAQIEPLAQMLGIVSHIIDYSSGTISGGKTPITTLAKHLKNNAIVTGLELGFSDKIKDSLVSMLEKKDIKKAS